VPKPSETALQEQTKELLCYLWDNYFEINPSSSITLMGVGDAYLGIKQLLTSRGISASLNPIPLHPFPLNQPKKKQEES
jgi:histone deacetylase 6